jgi:hypothetical protein
MDNRFHMINWLMVGEGKEEELRGKRCDIDKNYT